MKTLVLGLGSAGYAAAQLLQAQGHVVLAWDEQDSPQLQQRQAHLQELGIAVRLLASFQDPAGLEVEQIVVSPGIAWDHPALGRARAAGIAVVGEAELAWRSLRHLPWVGITGTNGKSTTTALVAAIFAAAGRRAPACGNIGLPLCQVALESRQTGRDPDWIIAELSSFQLEAADTLGGSWGEDPAPRIGIWTTFTPDHLERHQTLENYATIKARLLERASHPILNGDDPYLWQQRQRWPQALWTSVEQQEAPIHLRQGQIWIGDRPWVELGCFAAKMPGKHNLQNLLLAAAAAHLAGIEAESLALALEQFPGVPHRLETVRTIAGIRFINDSKATNYDAAAVGLKAIEAPIVLIAGGKPKQGDDGEWLDLICEKVSGVVLIGAASAQFANRLRQVNYTSYQLAGTLDVAVPAAFAQAQALQKEKPGCPVAVLLSPACASYDQYPNFERRGEHFRLCCQELPGAP